MHAGHRHHAIVLHTMFYKTLVTYTTPCTTQTSCNGSAYMFYKTFGVASHAVGTKRLRCVGTAVASEGAPGGAGIFVVTAGGGGGRGGDTRKSVGATFIAVRATCIAVGATCIAVRATCIAVGATVGVRTQECLCRLPAAQQSKNACA